MSYELSALSVHCEYLFSRRPPSAPLAQRPVFATRLSGILRRVVQDFPVNDGNTEHVALLCSETHRHLQVLAHGDLVAKGMKCPMADWLDVSVVRRQSGTRVVVFRGQCQNHQWRAEPDPCQVPQLFGLPGAHLHSHQPQTGQRLCERELVPLTASNSARSSPGFLMWTGGRQQNSVKQQMFYTVAVTLISWAESSPLY
ncbi:unnamed protein product [Pleuronectes platessa]|uniref:Uncharacterized protein n=1 Tax=Pleuronectes platessa TaxID=8262 RepID=A0A9N7Z3Z0_PLEPL|nr:unnamed protein product [Pleuronectes platessa]